MKVPVNGSYDEQNRRLRIKPFPDDLFSFAECEEQHRCEYERRIYCCWFPKLNPFYPGACSAISTTGAPPRRSISGSSHSNDTSELVMQHDEPEEIKPTVATKGSGR
jgi:hypothetical protein